MQMVREESDEERPLLSCQSEDQGFDSTSTVASVQELAGTRSAWVPILLGQIASLLICLSGITSIVLTQYGIAFPSVQNFSSYFLISIIFTTKLALESKGETEADFAFIVRSRGWKYLLIALADVGGNYLVVRAYQYTSLTSVQLLDCFSIPTVLVLSYFFLESRYGHFHYLGIILSLLGVICLVWADVSSGRTTEGSNPVIGDILCLSGAFLYGVSNVSQEFFVKNFNPTEFLAFIGFFGCLISAAQTFLFEDRSLLEINWTLPACLYLLTFGLTMFFFYTIVAHLMVMSSSVATNLSILSADFYSILAGVFLFHYEFSVLYFLSFILVMGGVGIFSLRPIITGRHRENVQIQAE
ncbi:unnamed protein product [Allacma fusca]|uniref:Solute carrier family 35 member F2 n=1 Tax=Allacma fusca TaxID=39272 RepID=A0A8J2NY13_9HEXA|nr:unnamed protein product [Allacma fusca]